MVYHLNCAQNQMCRHQSKILWVLPSQQQCALILRKARPWAQPLPTCTVPSHAFYREVLKWTSLKSSCSVSVTPSLLDSCVLTRESMRELPPPKISSRSSALSTSTLRNCLSWKGLLRRLGHASARSFFEVSKMNFTNNWTPPPCTYKQNTKITFHWSVDCSIHIMLNVPKF